MRGMGDFLSSKVEAAVDTGKRRAVNIVENVLGDTKQKLLNDITKDRDMPGGVRKVFQMVLGVYFSDVQQEVLDELAKRLKTLSYSEKKQKQKTDIQTTLLSIGINNSVYDYLSWKFFRKMLADTRAWILYNELPYDKSFWGKLRSPGWWLILCSKLYSGWGVQAFLYALRLSMLDRTDEWVGLGSRGGNQGTRAGGGGREGEASNKLLCDRQPHTSERVPETHSRDEKSFFFFPSHLATFATFFLYPPIRGEPMWVIRKEFTSCEDAYAAGVCVCVSSA